MTKTGAAARPTLDSDEETLVETLQRLRTPILVVGGAVILAGGGIWFMRSSAAKLESRASEAFAAGEAAYTSGNAALAQPELEKAAQRYKGTAAGTQASMLLAQILLDQGKTTEAIAALEGIRGEAPASLESGVESLIAAGYENAGKPKEAAEAFQRAAAAAEFVEDAESYRMDAARNLASAGDSAGAIAIYEVIARKEDSPYAGEAKVRLGELKTKA